MGDEYKTEERLTDELGEMQESRDDLNERLQRLEQSNEELRNQIQDLTAIKGLARELTSSLSLDEVIRSTSRLILSTIAPDLVLVYLIEGDQLILQNVPEDKPEFHKPEAQVKHVGQCLCGLAGEGEPVYSRDIHSDYRCTLDECKRSGLTSFAALPLSMGTEVFGVLGIASTAERDFSSQSTLLETLAAHISVALHNARMHDRARRHAEQLEEQVKRLTEAENALQERTRELDLRVMELTSLDRISRLAEKQGTTVEEVIQGTVDVMPSAWQYPEIAAVRAVIEGREFQSKNYRVGRWKQVGQVVAHGEPVGVLELSYCQARPEKDEGPFLKRERDLIDAIALKIGKLVEGRNAQEGLLEAYRHLEHIVQERSSELIKSNEQLTMEIAERRKTEEKLRASEERYRAIVEYQTDLICRFTPDYRLTFVNEAFCRYFGRTRDELLTESFLDFLPPEDREAARVHLSSVSPLHPVVTGEHQVIGPEGLLRWQYWTHRATFDEHRRPIDFQGVGRDITDRKNAEDALRESRELFVQFADQLPLAVSIKDENSRVQFANQYLKDALNAGSWIGRLPSEYRTAKEAEIAVEEDSRARQEGPIVTERWMTDANGVNRCFETHKFPVFRRTGRPLLGIVGLDITERKNAEQALREAHDNLEQKVKERTATLSQTNEQLQQEIVERKRIEEALRENEAKYRALFEQAAESICLVDPQTNRIVEFNQRAHDDLGYSREEFRLLGIADLDVGEPPNTINRRMHSPAHKRVESFEGKLRSKVGEVRSVLVSCRPIDFGGRELYQAMWADITERKRTEEALRRSEERFRAIFEGARDAIFIKDAAFRYTHVNPGMQKLLGMDASRIIGRTDEEIFGEKAGEHTREVDLRVFSGETIEEEHSRPVRGIEFTFHDIRVPLRNYEGDIVGICGISRDITGRRKVGRQMGVEFPEYPSMSMRATLEEARFAATTSSIVLLLGESGSGKDYLARWIHQHSLRADGPFFSINCAAVSKELAESELFGHEPGAFTGARGRKRGLLELAEGGTLLLNEIAELPLSLQSKLLTFLDTRSFVRVGGEKRIRVDARLIAATHRDLAQDLAAGNFLQPLYYRINVFSIRVPPLRERLADIPILVRELLARLAEQMQIAHPPSLPASEVDLLRTYHWPGNVRELRNVLERAVMLSEGGQVRVELPSAHADEKERYYRLRLSPTRTLREVTDEVTRVLCVEALHHTGGNKQQAARILGTSRDSVYRYMERYGIDDRKLTP